MPHRTTALVAVLILAVGVTAGLWLEQTAYSVGNTTNATGTGNATTGGHMTGNATGNATGNMNNTNANATDNISRMAIKKPIFQ